MNCGEESVGEFVIAGGDGAESLKLAEEALNEVAFTIEGEVGIAFHDAIGFGRNDWGDGAYFERFDQGVGIVCLVGEEGFGLDLFEQGSRLTDVGYLAGRE